MIWRICLYIVYSTKWNYNFYLVDSCWGPQQIWLDWCAVQPPLYNSHHSKRISGNNPENWYLIIPVRMAMKHAKANNSTNISKNGNNIRSHTVYPKKHAHGFVVLCFVVVMQSFIMNSHEVFIHIHQGCFAGTGAIVRLPQCQWSKPDGYGKISQCITTTKHSKAKTVCIFLGLYCMRNDE